MPEIYQDIYIKGNIIKRGVRSCIDRYEACIPILNSLPKSFKMLDIGASQGYFSFKMGTEFKARPTMIEESYTITELNWETGKYLNYLCLQNNYINNMVLLQKKVYEKELKELSMLEEFDLVLAFSVIHHMKRSSEESDDAYLGVIDAILNLAPVVLIENPINTGSHTRFIRKALLEKGGKIVYSSKRGTLDYEIYLFDKRDKKEKEKKKTSHLPNISLSTYSKFNGTFKNVKD